MVKTIFSGLLYWCVCTMVFAGETLPYFTADAVANIDKAAVRRDGNALVRQITEELAIVPREIPGMPHFTARCTEYELTDTGQGGYLVGDLRH
jgi:hypothetical protein